MPEGDTIHYAARRIRAVLEGHVPDEILTTHPRFARDEWPERLAGRRVTVVDAVGKHLLVRFEGGPRDPFAPAHARPLAHRSGRRAMAPLARHLAGDQTWPDGGRAVGRARPRAHRLSAQARLDPRLTQLGPDIVAPEPFDEARFLRRLRGDDPTRPIGDALLDQRTVAGIGNFWKVEGCFLAGIDPGRPVAEVSDEEARAIVATLRPRMQASAQDGHQSRFTTIYGKSGSYCPRCGPRARIAARHQGDDNRITYWCPSCQH